MIEIKLKPEAQEVIDQYVEELGRYQMNEITAMLRKGSRKRKRKAEEPLPPTALTRALVCVAEGKGTGKDPLQVASARFPGDELVASLISGLTGRI